MVYGYRIMVFRKGCGYFKTINRKNSRRLRHI